MDCDWIPALTSDAPTLHGRLLDALRRDIAAGVLPPGVRLPTHRTLAQALGLAIGTVTRAYAEGEREGLLVARVGRGSFVAGGQAAPGPADGPVSLASNAPSAAPAAGRFAEALGRLRRRGDLADYLHLAPHAGVDWHRQEAARWLDRAAGFAGADWRRLLICSGAQQAMALALGCLCRPGDTVLTEAATFYGVRAIAEDRGLRLAGVAMDREGLLPDALDRAAAETGARVLYALPTLQNPTARSQSAARRAEIAAVARRRDLKILEGDVYGPLARAAGAPGSDVVPLAALAPERTFYAASLSKVMASGLRVGFLVVPDDAWFDRLAGAMRAACYAPAPLAPLVAAEWLGDRTADAILAEIAATAAARTALAARILGDRLEPPAFPTSLHVWLPMGELAAERVAARAQRRGVALTPPAAMLVAPEQESGLRLCLNAQPDPATIERALRAVAESFAPDGDARSLV